MAERDDVDILWWPSVRLVRVESPSVEIIAQDLHDTVRDHEDEPSNMIYQELISTGGTEDLGGGLEVGLTSTLLNGKIFFDPRTVSVSNGTITTADAGGNILTDASATFSTDGILPGAFVFNVTDESVGSIIGVISDTQLLMLPISRTNTKGLDDGTTNSFQINDRYKIWNVEQVTVTGGNVVAVDSAGDAFSPVLPTFGTQVRTTSSSSATIQNLQDLQHAAFENGVWVAQSGSVTGTDYPAGNQEHPVNNLDDAFTIAGERGFTNIYLTETTLIDGNYPDIMFVAKGRAPTTVAPTANVDGCSFNELILSGTIGSSNFVNRCIVGDLTLTGGYIIESVLTGTLTVDPTVTGLHILRCVDGIPGNFLPALDCGGSGTPIDIHGYSGLLNVRNKTGSDAFSINFESGEVVFEATITQGPLKARGPGIVTNLSSVTPDTSGLNSSSATRKIVNPLYSTL